MHLILLILVNISYCISDSSKDNWYKSLLKDDADGWIDLRYLPNSIRSDPLSTMVHSYAERRLDFEFPYYGELLGSFLATGQGFLYMGNNYGQALYETKFIAPLMAGFSPTAPPRKPQDVRHFSNGTIYINQWSDMSLESQRDDGVFTFQVQLHSNGVIKFLYKEVPIPIADINSTEHVAIVGIADAYRGEIYTDQLITYNEIHPKYTLIRPDTTVTFTPIPTCGSQKSCKSCVGYNARCVWCSSLDRCSTQEGLERYNNLWKQHHCPDTAVNSCQGIKTDTTPNRPEVSYSATSHATFDTTPEIVTLHPDIRFPVDPMDPKDDTEPPPNPTQAPKHDSTSMTIITTISITAVCIAAILVISALLILKLRKPVLSPIKMEEIKSCNEDCSRTFIEQNNTSQPYPQYQFVMTEDHDHTVSVVV